MRKIRLYIERGSEQQECLWAEHLRDCLARISCIPVSLTYGLGDIVEFNTENFHIIQLVRKGTQTFGGIYEPVGDKPTDLMNRKGIQIHLSHYGIVVEVLTDRMFVMAVPLNMNEQKLFEAVQFCPVQFELFTAQEN